MACGLKTIAAIQKPFDIQIRLLLLQSLVFSLLYYPSLLLLGTSHKLILSLDKQINCALKTIAYRKKIWIIERFENKIWNVASNSLFEKWKDLPFVENT